MSTIDWDAIHGQRIRPETRSDATPEFSQDEIDAALAKVEALPATGDDADEIATFWPVEDKFTLSQLDFRDVTVTDVPLADLYASNDTLSRKKLTAHVQSPGEAVNESPFDAHPIVFQSKKKQTIIDGQHRLAALMLLDVVSWPVFLVPK